MQKKIIGAAVGPCVHIAGLSHFLTVCEQEGWQTVSLGPAVAVADLMSAVCRERPDVVAVSYRLTPSDLSPILDEIKSERQMRALDGSRWIFGGTPDTAAAARDSGIFDRVFDGTESLEQVRDYVRGQTGKPARRVFATGLVQRILDTYPMPLIRHHYGEPDLDATVRGARRIAKAQVLDVLSIGPDQNAQEHFFRPDEMDPNQNGAGGVPVRTSRDLLAIYQATRRGNYPLVRCYSGTRDLLKWAEMSLDVFHNAWGAIPLCWYSALDGRSQTAIPEAIAEKQAAMRFYGARGVPVEVNESHQWSLRDAHDSLAVAMAFLAAYNAKVQGVKQYIVQMMFNTPPSTSPAMDIAKMQAKLELIGGLSGTDFEVFREVRAGITSLPIDLDEAKGHMAASTVHAMTMKPHIVHVVGYTEACRVVTAKEVIESCRIARGAVRLALKESPDPSCDPRVKTRKRLLVSEARDLLEGIRKIGRESGDPWSEPAVIAEAIRMGVLDAPHFRGQPHLCGRIATACIEGGWDAVDPATGKSVRERERLAQLGIRL